MMKYDLLPIQPLGHLGAAAIESVLFFIAFDLVQFWNHHLTITHGMLANTPALVQ
jgi:hypothetical protein